MMVSINQITLNLLTRSLFMMYSACASRVTPGSSHRCLNLIGQMQGLSLVAWYRPRITNNKDIVIYVHSSLWGSYTEGEGLEDKNQAYPYLLSNNVKNLAQSGASEYLITTQVEEAVKMKPDLIVIGHTSEYRWHVWDFRNDITQGFIVANHVMQNEKYYRNWILSEQILANQRKNTKNTGLHGTRYLFFKEKKCRFMVVFCSETNTSYEKVGLGLFIIVVFHFIRLVLTDDYVNFHLDFEKQRLCPRWFSCRSNLI